MVKTVVIGLGNTILRDDGAGVFVARDLRRRLLGTDITVIETECAGMNLIEMLKGFDRAVLVDAIRLDGVAPGTVLRLVPDDLKITPRLASCHDIDIVTALELGRRLGLRMPREVSIYAIQAADTQTLREGCTRAVRAALRPTADEIEALLNGREGEKISIRLAERDGGDA